MRLVAHQNSALPKLAWLAVVDRPHGVVTLDHGSLVEVRPSFWIEGVWNGPFESGDFGETDCVFGSGGIISGDSIRFVASASTTDYLYYAESARQVTVSNSLPLLLASNKDALDPRCLDYPAICDSITCGIDEYRRDIPTQKGQVRRQMYRNLDVLGEKVSESEKRMPPRFKCFEDYRNYLRANYALIAANARDGARRQSLQIWSTQSKGYDSTAVNAIAGLHGIDKVFTVSKAKSIYHLAHNDDGKLPDDDGGEICEALGLNCIRINRRAFAEEFDDEYLYYCALHRNEDANLKEINRHVSKVTLLLNGTLGDMWYTKDCLKKFGRQLDLGSEMRAWSLAGRGMAELRLVVGFIQLPLPFIGARRRADIVDITESSEMDPWRLGTRYDRPIPRRIAEEAGVPRQAFGQFKMGSVVIFSRPSIPYSKTLRLEFFEYLASEKIMARSRALLWPVVRWVNTILMLKNERHFAVVHYTERVISKLIGRKFLFTLMWSKLEGALFCFCVNRTAATYALHLSRVKDSLPESLESETSGSKVRIR